jgi:site-specific recombinase XerC
VVIRTYQVFSAILADAVRDHRLARNPAAGVKLPRKTRKRPVYVSHKQVRALAAAAGEYEPLVLVLVYLTYDTIRVWPCCGSLIWGFAR